jgi:hypothetical protein
MISHLGPSRDCPDFFSLLLLLGADEQIFGANEQIIGRDSERLRGVE